MKRMTTSVALAAVLGLAAYTMAGAQGVGRGPGGGFDGPRPGMRGGFGMLRGIDLTDTQREQIRAIREAERQAQPAPAAGTPLHRQLQAELFAEVPDPHTLETLQRQIVEADAARLAGHVEIQQKIAQVLTPEQRETIRTRLAQAPQRGPARQGRVVR